MPSSRPRTFTGPFTGLSLRNTRYNESPDKAIVAENVVVKNGQVEIRPGRLEKAENQLTPNPGIGVHSYTNRTAGKRSDVLVTTNGIYQRVTNG